MTSSLAFAFSNRDGVFTPQKVRPGVERIAFYTRRSLLGIKSADRSTLCFPLNGLAAQLINKFLFSILFCSEHVPHQFWMIAKVYQLWTSICWNRAHTRAQE